ncbi:hypothetical protein J2TS4_34630 [Paenibacillus sp. J2TS4]|nr:hypothetical protein J2TS4_34630 [Paenibacillus sp. J2TS4]
MLDDGLIITILNDKKHTLDSSSEEEKREVLREYVDQVVIQPSKDINSYDTEITYRVFKYGGVGN